MTTMAELFLVAPPRLAGRKGARPPLPEGSRYAIRFAHEYFGEPPEPTYPIDVSAGIVNWLMLGNGPDPTCTVGPTPQQGYGDCVVAAFEHDRMISIVNGKLAVPLPTADGTVTVYLDYDNGQDQGVIIGDFLLWLYQQKLIRGFAPVELSRVDATMAQFNRGVILGVNLTDNNEAEFNAGQPLDASAQFPPDPQNGHGVLKVASTSPSGPGKIVTWALGYACTADFLQQCPTESWVILTDEDEQAFGPERWGAMVADLEALPQARGPITAPEPVPVPATPPPTPAPAPPHPGPAPVLPPVYPSELGDWYEAVLVWFHAAEQWVDAHTGTTA